LPGRGRIEALLAIVAILAVAAMVAVAVWVLSIATSGVGAEDVTPKAATGSAIVHDDAGNMPTTTGVGSAVIHDDAGTLKPR
jgi:hypothetical protein